MKLMKLKMLGFALMAGAFLLDGGAAAQAQTALRMAHATAETDLVHSFATHFKEELEARTNGEVTVTIFPNGQLGNDAQMLDGVRAGVIDVMVAGSSAAVGIVPEIQVFDLPFMFENSKAAYAALDGTAGAKIMEKLEAQGLKGLAMPESGWRQMTNSKHPIKGPADLDGLRMRVNSSVVLQNTFAALKANPQPLDFSELYTALETGVIDAQDQPLNLLLSGRFYEVQKYLSLTRHSYSPLLSSMNLAKFNSLTEEQQKAVMEAAKAAAATQRQEHADREEKMIAELEGHGVEVTREVDTAAFQAAVKPVWDNFRKSYGDEMIDLIEADKKDAAK